MALRLQLIALNDDSFTFYSVGTVHQSFTIIPPLSQQQTTSGSLYDGVMTVEPTTVVLSAPAANAQAIKTPSPAKIWSQASQRTGYQITTEGKTIIPWSSGLNSSSITTQLDHFRQFVFEKMVQIFCQCHTASSSSTSKIQLFWRTLKGELDNLQYMISEESQMLLLHYYRVIPFLSSLSNFTVICTSSARGHSICN